MSLRFRHTTTSFTLCWPGHEHTPSCQWGRAFRVDATEWAGTGLAIQHLYHPSLLQEYYGILHHEARLQKRLQKKGTRSATRRKIALSGRERRLKLQTNHRIAKSIVQAHPHTLIGLEELSGIRERTRRRKRRRKKNGKGTEPVSPKARRANRHTSQWAFAELHSMIAYKAVLSRSSLAIKVDANYTSQACPLCGYTDKRNRPGKGLLFRCRNEQCPYRLRTGRPYTLHADLVGARNIAMRTLLIRQDWVRTGVLSVLPDASDSETKAARLARYAELRWSPDASLS